MTIMEMLGQSTILTVLGMSVVFIFLWLMIICVTLTGKAIHKMGLDKDVTAPPPAPRTKGVTPEVTSAITAAVVEFRKEQS
ncbi:MAG: OadG family protein [Treponema sp.]|jgi:oxaloacetate decarboxylase gamma subunit|nr:OadG family protein [Treponema sp.]